MLLMKEPKYQQQKSKQKPPTIDDSSDKRLKCGKSGLTFNSLKCSGMGINHPS